MDNRDNLHDSRTISFIGREMNLAEEAPNFTELEPAERLKKLCERKLAVSSAAIKDRLKHELGVFHYLGLDEFVLALFDIHRFAVHARQLAMVEVPAFGSLLLHVLGLSSVDPLRHGLSFDFYFAPGRKFAPIQSLSVSGEARSIAENARQRFVWTVKGDDDNPDLVYRRDWQPAAGGPSSDATIFVTEHPALAVIRNTVELIRAEHGSAALPKYLPENDLATMALFQDGKTDGIYSFNDTGTLELLRRVKPAGVGELAAVIAIDRPHFVPKDMVSNYLDHKHGGTRGERLNDDVDKVLRETHGILLFWEQIGELVHCVAGLSLQDGRKLGMALFTRKPERVEQFRVRFLAGAEQRNVASSVARAIFEKIEIQGPFTYCKANAISTAHVAYQMGYLKAHFPNEFDPAALGKLQDEFWATFKAENRWAFVAERESCQD